MPDPSPQSFTPACADGRHGDCTLTLDTGCSCLCHDHVAREVVATYAINRLYLARILSDLRRDLPWLKEPTP